MSTGAVLDAQRPAGNGIGETDRLYMSRNNGLFKNAGSFGDSLEISDEDETVVYRVTGKLNGLTIKMLNASGAPVFDIRRKFVSLSPGYSMIKDNKAAGIVRRKIRFSQPEFSGQIYGRELRITGDFGSFSFSICLDGREIGRVDTDCLTWGDVYAIDIIDREYRELVSVLTVIVYSSIFAEENS